MSEEQKFKVTCVVSAPELDESVLSEARRILDGDRQADYGDYVENFGNIAKEASRWSKKELTPLDCVNVMIAVKTTREQYNHKRDNLVDLAAYLQIRNDVIKSTNDGTK